MPVQWQAWPGLGGMRTAGTNPAGIRWPTSEFNASLTKLRLVGLMRFLTVFLMCFPLACSMAGPGFRGVTPVTREVEGSRFLLRVKDRMAEVTRTSFEFPARFGPISERAQKAVHLETGCEPEWVTGDPAMMVMGLSCNGEPAPPEPRNRSISCEIFDAVYSERFGGSAAVECTQW